MAERIRRILLVGDSMAETAIQRKLKGQVGEIHNAHGNAATNLLIGISTNIYPDDTDTLEAYAHDKKIDFTIVGSEPALAIGTVNQLRENGLETFGASQEAAKIGTDNCWQTNFLNRHPDIPHAAGFEFSDIDAALAYLAAVPYDVVIKTGIDSGRTGVVMPEDLRDAGKTVRAFLVDKTKGPAGDRVIIQERLAGREVAVAAFTDGVTTVPLLPTREYKYTDGPSPHTLTDGVGSYCPVLLPDDVSTTITRDILQKTVDALKDEGIKLQGILNAQVILTTDGPKVIDFHVKFGDLQAHTLLTLLKSDLLPTLVATTDNTLTPEHVEYRGGSAVCVVGFAHGYPGTPHTGDKIKSFRAYVQDPNLTTNLADASYERGTFTTRGSRPLFVTGYGDNLYQARKRTYSGLGEPGPSFRRMGYCREIANDGLADEW